ncbi:MAG: adenylate kinase [Cenarchaeum symbiont of Oopsacas minuta]|nr:adenylate kinase [Cenarchaeum symbiont of Oopsacas minuta]
MAENKKIIIVGIPGVGKTTLVKKLVELLKAKQHSVRVDSFGTLMLEEVHNDISNRDELRKLDIFKQKKLQNRVATKIASFTEDIVLVDTHAFISTDSGFYPGLPNNILEIIKPDHYISVSARPEEVYNRRMSDNTRSRDIVTIESIKKELAVQDSMVAACSVLSGSPILTVLNSEGKANDVAVEIIEGIGV